jgi:AcrR family transcriptional regulator
MAKRVSPAAKIRRKAARDGANERRDLVGEALQLLSKEGVEGTSIGVLSERSGYSKGGIMAHFGSKDAMVQQLVEEGVSRTRRFFREELKDAATPSERLMRTLQAYGRYWTSGVFEGGCLFLNTSVDAIGEDDVAIALRKAARTFISDFASIVRIGQATGDFRADVNADEIGEKLMTLCMGCAWTARMTGDPSIFARMQPAADEIIRGIARRERIEV